MPATQALLPEITVKQISGAEWLSSGMTVATVGLIGAGGVIAQVGFPILGGVATTETALNWNKMTTESKALSVLTDAAFLLPVIKSTVSTIVNAPTNAEISEASYNATQTANIANKAINEWINTSPTDPNYATIRDKALAAGSEASEANNTLIQVLKDNPTNTMAKYVSNQSIMDAATTAKLAQENMKVTIHRLILEIQY